MDQSPRSNLSNANEPSPTEPDLSPGLEDPRIIHPSPETIFPDPAQSSEVAPLRSLSRSRRTRVRR